MSKQFILIITHGTLSSNKLLLNSIHPKGLDTKYAMIANYKGNNKSNDPTFNLEPFALKKDSVGEEYDKFKGYFPNKEELFTLQDLAPKYFNIISQITPELLNNDYSEVFDFYMFPDVNLAEVGENYITKTFDEAVHRFGRSFIHLTSDFEHHFYVYGYSQSTIANEQANMYFDQKEVNGLQLNVPISFGYSDSKKNIHKKLEVFSQSDERNTNDKTVSLDNQFTLSISSSVSKDDVRLQSQPYEDSNDQVTSPDSKVSSSVNLSDYDSPVEKQHVKSSYKTFCDYFSLFRKQTYKVLPVNGNNYVSDNTGEDTFTFEV